MTTEQPKQGSSKRDDRTDVPSTREALVVLGMHRSGTSLLARGVASLGYDLGDNIMPPQGDNARGFWEDLDIVALNDKLLCTRHSAWDGIAFPLEEGFKSASAEPIHLAARNVLQQRLTKGGKIAIKDPRMCLLLPFWRDAFTSLDISVKYVMAYRDPKDVAESLGRRNGFSFEKSIQLWVAYNTACLLHLSKDFMVVDYQKMLVEPRRQLERMDAALNLDTDWAGAAGEIDRFCKEYVDSGLCHAKNEKKDLDNDDDISPHAIELAKILTRFSGLDSACADPALPGYRQALEANSHTMDVRNLRLYLLDSLARVEKGQQEAEGYSLEISGQQERIEKQADLLLEKDARIEEQAECIRGQERMLQDQAQLIQRQTLQIEERNRHIASRDVYTAEKEKQALYYKNLYERVQNSLSFRISRAVTWPLRYPVTTFPLARLRENGNGMLMLKLMAGFAKRPRVFIRLMNLERVKNLANLLIHYPENAPQVFSEYMALLNKPDSRTRPHAEKVTNEDLEEMKTILAASERPCVSVIIPVHNHVDHTLNCLLSICRHMPRCRFEVILADDASTDDTRERISVLPGVTYLHWEQNLGFLRTCNRAVEAAAGPFLFFLNNDTRVTDGWLDALVAVFDRCPDAGIVGSRLLYPDGRLQEAGGIIWKDGSGWNYGKGDAPEKPEYLYFKEVDYVSGAALMIPRKLFLDIGKFDERYSPAYYEDTDLAFAVRKTGLKVYLQPESNIVHFEGVSHGRDVASGVKQHQISNRVRFVHKWKSTLQREQFDRPNGSFRARDRSADKPTVLVIDHHVPHFDKDAGSRSTYQYLKLLCELGCNVKFMGDNFFKHEPYTSVLQRLGIEVLYGDHYAKDWKSWLSDNAAEIDVIYLMRPHVTEKYIDFINALEIRPKTIYFGHDLHYLRTERQYRIEGQPKLQRAALDWKRREFALLDKIDQAYYPSEYEVAQILKEKPQCNVKAIPLYYFDNSKPVRYDFDRRKDLLFVGGFNHPPNADSIHWFVNEIFPSVVREAPDLQLIVVGSNTPKSVFDLAGPNISVRGYLPDEELKELHESIRLIVAPLRYGAGIKGKVLEGLRAGVPVVTTSIGAEGIPQSDRCLLVRDDADEFASAVLDVYRHRETAENLSQSGAETIRRYFSKQAAADIIINDFIKRPVDHELRLYRIQTFDEYLAHEGKMQTEYRRRQRIEEQLATRRTGGFSVKGFSYPAGKTVRFKVGPNDIHKEKINWRESLVCPATGLNNRMRSYIHLIEKELGLHANDHIYITEERTELYRFLKRSFPNLVGSEYLGDAYRPGEVDANGIRNEDMTNLSFASGSFDSILTFDCFEHIPGFQEAFRECFRVLKNDGNMFFSVPFHRNKASNTIRAQVDRDTNKTVFLLEPEFHEDPVRTEGCLCYTHFGWEMLEQIEKCGFSEVYALLFWSLEYVYLGGEQIVFVARK